MTKTLKIAILGSTRGTSIRPIMEKIHKGVISNVEIACVISNRKTSGLLEFSKELFGEESDRKVLYKPKFKTTTSEDYDVDICKTLIEYNVNYIFLVGWMRLLTSKFVNAFRNKIINIHPSLLPAFAGQMDLDIHSEVLKRGCKVTGATVMYVDEGADTGPIIDQYAIRIPNNITPLDLKVLVQKEETKLLEETILDIVISQ